MLPGGGTGQQQPWYMFLATLTRTHIPKHNYTPQTIIQTLARARVRYILIGPGRALFGCPAYRAGTLFRNMNLDALRSCGVQTTLRQPRVLQILDAP